MSDVFPGWDSMTWKVDPDYAPRTIIHAVDADGRDWHSVDCETEDAAQRIATQLNRAREIWRSEAGDEAVEAPEREMELLLSPKVSVSRVGDWMVLNDGGVIRKLPKWWLLPCTVEPKALTGSEA